MIGMRWIAGRDYERMPFSVMSAGAGLLFHDQFSVPPAGIRSGFLRPVAPTANPDHLVELLPFGKALFGGVIRNEATALSNELLERSVNLRRPWIPVVIRDNDVDSPRSRAGTRSGRSPSAGS